MYFVVLYKGYEQYRKYRFIALEDARQCVEDYSYMDRFVTAAEILTEEDTLVALYANINGIAKQ